MILALTLNLGYFFTDNFVVGATINYDYSKSFSLEKYTNNEIVDKGNSLSAGPFLRLYMGGNTISPYIDVNFCLGKYNISRESDNTSNNYNTDAFVTIFNFGGGVAFFLNESVSIDILAYYDKTKLRPSENKDIKEINSGVELDVGFQVYLK